MNKSLIACCFFILNLMPQAFGGVLTNQISTLFDVDIGARDYYGEAFSERSLVGVQDGNYYFGSVSGKMTIINSIGSIKCSYLTDGWIMSNVVFDENKTAYFIGIDMYLYALNTDCSLRWKSVVENQGQSVAIGSDGTIYAGAGSFIQAFDKNGNQKWAKAVGSWVLIETVGSDGTLYVTTANNGVSAVDSSGNLKWSSSYAGRPRISGITMSGLLILTPMDPDRWIYAVDITNGELRWRIPVTTSGGSGAVEGNSIYILNGKHLYAISSIEGAVIWDVIYDQDAGDSSNSLLSIGRDGFLYFSGFAKKALEPRGKRGVYAFDKTGNLVAKDMRDDSAGEGVNFRSLRLVARNAAPMGGVFVLYDGRLQILAVRSAETIAANQTITFGTAPTLSTGGTGSVSAAASSGLAVTYSSLTPSVCTVSSSMVTAISAGICTIAANQAGNTGYSAAAQVTQSIQVTQPQSTNLSQTIGAMKFSPSTLSVGGVSVVSATATSGLSVIFSSTTPNICTVTPSQASLFSPVIYTVTGVSVGVCTIAANQAGGTVLLGGTFNAAPQTTQNITVRSNQYDCIFNWAETNFPQYFSPANSTSANYAQYQYRYYAGTGNYMAISSADMNVWVLGPSFGSNFLNVGPIANFLSAAGCPG